MIQIRWVNIRCTGGRPSFPLDESIWLEWNGDTYNTKPDSPHSLKIWKPEEGGFRLVLTHTKKDCFNGELVKAEVYRPC